MADVQLDTSYLEGGIANVNFFNGRVLTADDLRDQQAAEADRHRRLGRAVGEGVVAGLQVKQGNQATSVAVSEGAAVTRQGDVLELTADVQVPLVRPAPTGGQAGQPAFAPCPAESGGATLAGPGAYLLVLSPASASRGQAPRVGLDSSGVARDCGPRYTVDGLSFRLLGLDVLGLAAQAQMDADDLAVLRAGPQDELRAKLRNVLAHLFLGTVPSRLLFVDPFRVGVPTGPSASGPLDELRDRGKLTDADVPLALLTWTQGGVELIDGWAVRRRPVAGGTVAPAWNALVGPRRAAEGEATLLQFQEQLAAMTGPTQPDPAGVRAAEHFRYLPAAGLVPTTGEGAGGFEPGQFFEDVATLPEVVIPGAKVEPLLRAALGHPPIDLAAGELVFLYRVRETTQLLEGAEGGAAPVQPYLVFSAGSLPYQGETELEIQAVFPSGPLHPGDRIEVRGRNFGFSLGVARVFFDAFEVDPLQGSSDNKLVVTVPLIKLPEEGREVVLRADNGVDSDSVSVRVEPREGPLDGQLDVDWSALNPSPLEAGRPGDIVYRVTSRLSRVADVDLAVKVDPEVPRLRFQFRDVDGDQIRELARMRIDETRDVVLHIEEVRDEAMTLTFAASAGDISKADVRTFTPGEAPPEPDDSIVIQVNSFSVQGQTDPAEGRYDAAKSTVSLRATRIGMLDITGSFAEPGAYERTLTLAAGASGWQAAFNQSVPDPIEIDDGDLVGGPAGRSIDFAVMPGLGASATAKITLTVQRRQSERRQVKVFNLELLP
jgi:IPT/TIG domain